MAKNKRLTIVRAGRLVRAVLYSQPMATDHPKARAAKSQISSAARQRMNQRASWEKCEELLAANFSARDLWITFTYRDADLPHSREEAVRCLKRFIAQLRAVRAERGESTFYIKNVEHLTDEGERWHHHMALNATGHDYEEIRSLWARWGDNVQIDPLLDGDHDFAARAKYLCKERQPVGKQAWTPSRGLKRPTRTSELVDEALALYVPAGAVMLDRESKANTWGEFIYLKYLLPAPPPEPEAEDSGPGRRRSCGARSPRARSFSVSG